MAFRNNLHGRAVQYDRDNIYLYGRPVNRELRGLGKDYYVDSGVDRESGLSPDEAVGTIEELISGDKLTANQGDRLIVMPGHAETLGDESLVVDIAGVHVLGLGWGSAKPQINHNHANAEVSIAADNVKWTGIRHLADVTSVAVGIEIEDGSSYCEVGDCDFGVVLAGTDEFTVSVRTNDASNNAWLHDLAIHQGAAAAVSAISLTKDTDLTVIERVVTSGDFSTACINGLTTASTRVLISDCLLTNGIGGDLNSEPCIEMFTGTTGWIEWVRCYCNLATKAAAIVADAMLLHETYYNEDVSSAGTSGLIGTASADD